MKIIDNIIDKSLEIPKEIHNPEGYREIIQKAFELTNGLLSLDDFTAEEDSRHINIKLTSKGVDTNFRINRSDNHEVDIKNIVRGLNKALTDIFYLGSERFYLINGKVIPFGIAFISNKQKRSLLKEGLIGKMGVSEKTAVAPTAEPISKEKKELDIKEKKEPQKQKTDVQVKDTEIDMSLIYLMEKLDKKTDFQIFHIIYHPTENTKNTLSAATYIAKKRNFPNLSLRQYKDIAEANEALIDKIEDLYYKKNRRPMALNLIAKFNLSTTEEYVIFSEAKIRNSKKKNPDSFYSKISEAISLKTMIYILIAIYTLITFVSKC